MSRILAAMKAAHSALTDPRLDQRDHHDDLEMIEKREKAAERLKKAIDSFPDKELLTAARIAFQVIERFGFGCMDQNPKGIRDLLYLAIGNAERAASHIRCQECGDPVVDYFDHVDRDCTGNLPEKVAAGQLLPNFTPEERAAAIVRVMGDA